MPFVNKRRKYASKRRAVPRRKRVYKSSKTFVKKVKSILHNQIETKNAYHNQAMVGYNSAIASPADLTFPLPNVPQNVTESGRIGDQIRCQSLKIQGILTMGLSYSGTFANTRIGVRVMVVQPKLYTNRDVIQSEWSAWTTNLLRKGGTNSAFNGDISDLHAEINTDLITKYYDKVFYMTIPFSPSGAAIETLNSTKFFTVNLKLRNKLLRYNTGYYGNLAPSNYCPVLLCGYVHLDGSAADTVDTQVSMQYISNLAYEDA